MRSRFLMASNALSNVVEFSTGNKILMTNNA